MLLLWWLQQRHPEVAAPARPPHIGARRLQRRRALQLPRQRPSHPLALLLRALLLVQSMPPPQLACCWRWQQGSVGALAPPAAALGSPPVPRLAEAPLLPGQEGMLQKVNGIMQGRMMRMRTVVMMMMMLMPVPFKIVSV